MEPNHSRSKYLRYHVALAGILGLLAGACPGQDSTLPYRWINVRQHGAVGDGTTDDTPAIVAALKAARAMQPATGVYFPAGTYYYADNIRLEGVAVCGEGMARTILKAADLHRSALILTGDSPLICDLTIRAARPPQLRSAHGIAAGLAVLEARNFTIRRVAIGPVASAGILVRKSGGTAANPATIQDCTIGRTLADGIHLTAGTQYVDVAQNTVGDTGDDLIAVVSYRTDAALCHDIRILHNLVSSQTHGRGISVVGGRDVTIEGNTIKATTGAAIYLVSEASYNTSGVADIIIRKNTMENVATELKLGHAAIQLAGRPPLTGSKTSLAISNVVIADNLVEGTGRNGIQIGPYASTITVTGNTIARAQASAIAIGPAVADITIGSTESGARANIINSCGEYGIKVDPAGSKGVLRISGTRFESVNTKGLGYVDVINIGKDGTFASVHVTDNHLEQPVGLPVERLIESQSPVTEALRNTSNINLGSLIAK